MDIYIVAGQVLSVIAMLLSLIGMQCRSTRNFFICQESVGLLFVIIFLMLGAWSGMAMNIFGVVRPEILRHKKFADSKWVLAGLLAFLLLCSFSVIYFFNEKWYLILIAALAQGAGTVAMWSRNGRTIRVVQVTVVSPLWLLYNFLLPVLCIGGILNESINFTSAAVALFRYRKEGFVRE